MSELAAWLTDRDVCRHLGISERTLRELLAVEPSGIPSAYVHTSVGARFPRRRWRADLLWSWLEAIRERAAANAGVVAGSTTTPSLRLVRADE